MRVAACGRAHSTGPEPTPRFRSGRCSEWALGVGEQQKGLQSEACGDKHTRGSTCHVSHVFHAHSHREGFSK